MLQMHRHLSSQSFWRALREGEGQFSVEDEQWYDNFEKGGKWAAKYSAPEKTVCRISTALSSSTHQKEW